MLQLAPPDVERVGLRALAMVTRRPLHSALSQRLSLYLRAERQRERHVHHGGASRPPARRYRPYGGTAWARSGLVAERLPISTRR